MMAVFFVGYIGSFLLVLGFLQLVSVYFHLRGASLTGPLSGPGILFGFLLFTSGVWFVIDEPLLRIVTAILISIPLAWILLLLFGIVTNIGWDPSKEFIRSQRGADASVTEVNIGVRDQMRDQEKPNPSDHIGGEFADACLKVRQQQKLHKPPDRLLGGHYLDVCEWSLCPCPLFKVLPW